MHMQCVSKFMGEARRQREKNSGLKRRQEREERSSPLMIGGGEGLREVRQRDHLTQRNVQLLNHVLLRAEDTPICSFLMTENCCGVYHHLR